MIIFELFIDAIVSGPLEFKIPDTNYSFKYSYTARTGHYAITMNHKIIRTQKPRAIRLVNSD